MTEPLCENLSDMLLKIKQKKKWIIYELTEINGYSNKFISNAFRKKSLE